MPSNRITQSPAATSGRTRTCRGTSAVQPGAHVIDRARAVHALLAAGQTPAAVQRRLSKSKGYVSVLGYLGAAVAGMEPDSVAALRTAAATARVVWPLVTRARTDERATVAKAVDSGTADSAREEIRGGPAHVPSSPCAPRSATTHGPSRVASP